MKKLLKYLIPCMGIALSFTSCDSTMDSKASIEASFDNLPTPVLNAATATAETFAMATASSSVSSLENVLEIGFQISTDETFKNYTTAICDELSEVFSASLNGLSEQTLYYVRAYAFTKTGILVFGEATSFTTPKAPIFSLDGIYTATEYELDNNKEWSLAGQYKIGIEFDANDPTIVYISNIWDGEMTVQGVWDETTGIVTVPNYSTIFLHPSYGDVWMRGVNEDITGYTNDIQFQFTALGGKIVSTPWAAQCAAGDFGFYRLTMEHL